MDSMSLAHQWSLVAVLLMACVHVMAARLDRGPFARPQWLSIANGLSVAYVLVHLLPELADMQSDWIKAWPDRPLRWLDRQVYYAALIGLLLALGLERVTSRKARPEPTFWLHTSLFALYNLIVGGFALQIQRPSLLIFATIGFGAHFFVTDHGLNRQHPRAYAHYGRWVLAGAILLGWIVAIATRPHVIIVAALTGLLGGGMLLDVIKDEIPEKQEGQFALFVVGALGYASLLLIARYTIVND